MNRRGFSNWDGLQSMNFRVRRRDGSPWACVAAEKKNHSVKSSLSSETADLSGNSNGLQTLIKLERTAVSLMIFSLKVPFCVKIHFTNVSEQ